MADPIELSFSGPDDWSQFDRYHALASEVQQGIAALLDRVLQRHGVGEEAMRRKIVRSFVFDFSEALDSHSPLEQVPDDGACWLPVLGFLMARPEAGRSAGEAVVGALLTTNSALHESALDQADAYFTAFIGAG